MLHFKQTFRAGETVEGYEDDTCLPYTWLTLVQSPAPSMGWREPPKVIPEQTWRKP